MSAESPPSRGAANQPVGMSAALLALLTAALWGGTPAAIRFSLESFSPVMVAALRFALGALFMVFWCRLEGSPLLPRVGQWGAVVTAGVLLFVQISLFNVGVAWSNASHGSLMINTFVFWVVVIEHFVTRGDRLSARKTVGLAIAAAGAAVVLGGDEGAAPPRSLGGDAASLLGDLVLLLSAAVLAVKIVFVKHSLKHVEPGKLILWHDLVGVVLFGAYACVFESPIHSPVTTQALLGVAYQGVLVAGLCFAIQTLLLRRHSASRISIFAFATPLFGIAAGVALRGDAVSPWLLVSAACVAAGILLVNTEQTAKKTKSPEAAEPSPGVEAPFSER